MKKLSKKSLNELNISIAVFLLFIGIIGLIAPVQSQAGKKAPEIKIPNSIHPGLHHFLDQVDPEKNIAFDPGLVAGVMEFIEGPKNDVTLPCPHRSMFPALVKKAMSWAPMMTGTIFIPAKKG